MTHYHERGACLQVVLVLLIVGGTLGAHIVYNVRAETLTITVQEKSRGAEESGSDYLVWSTDGEVFAVDDAFWYGHFRASDTYGQLQVGGTYAVRVIGYRLGFLSMYRNIIRVTPLDATTLDP